MFRIQGLGFRVFGVWDARKETRQEERDRWSHQRTRPAPSQSGPWGLVKFSSGFGNGGFEGVPGETFGSVRCALAPGILVHSHLAHEHLCMHIQIQYRGKCF